MTVKAATGDMQKPLHVAAEAVANLTVIELLLEQDPAQCRYTDDSFQTPLHKAVMGSCHLHRRQARDARVNNENIELLVAAFPDAVDWTDTNGETPADIAIRMLGRKASAPLVQLLRSYS